MSDPVGTNSESTSPVAGEVDREAVGKGVDRGAESSTPLSLCLLRKGGGNRLRLRRGLRFTFAIASLTVVVAITVASWIASLGPAPLGEGLSFSTVVVDRNGKLLRPYATHEGRWRLLATREGVDPRFLNMLLAYEDSRFLSHRGVDPLALGYWSRANAHGWRNFDKWCAQSKSSRSSARTKSLRFISALRPMAAIWKAFARPRSPISGRSRAGSLWRKRRCS